MKSEDTISAIATPMGEGGLAVIRMSGKDAVRIATGIFRRGKGNELLSEGEPRPNQAYFGRVIDGTDEIDEVIMTFFRQPHSYTCEDTIEISCHGGQTVATRIVTLTIQCGARHAYPGEFTKRAFLNGRIDLTQAEAVSELIRAGSDECRKASLKQLQGSMRTRVSGIREDLLMCLSRIEADLDFNEDEAFSATHRASLITIIKTITISIDQMASLYRESQTIRQGYRVVLVGAPNVGKSSLLNALLGRERAIVSPIPGTTRDTVEESTVIGGVTFRLVDTAGIHEAKMQLEKEGVRRAIKEVTDADVVLMVLENGRKVASNEVALVTSLATKPHLVVVNKFDLPCVESPWGVANGRCIPVSAKTGQGLRELKTALLSTIGREASSLPRQHDFLLNSRHREALGAAHKHLIAGIRNIEQNAPLELAACDVRLASESVGEIIGTTVSEDILDRVFSTFCIGK